MLITLHACSTHADGYVNIVFAGFVERIVMNRLNILVVMLVCIGTVYEQDSACLVQFQH
jgi:hypothetical protein